MDMKSHDLFRLALAMVDKIGSVKAKSLIAYCGSAEAVFKESRKALIKIPGISNKTADKIFASNTFQKAEKELAFIRDRKIEMLYFLDESYPSRLKNYDDAPLCLFYKGNVSLNKKRHVAIVGTRTPTERGRHNCEKIVAELNGNDISIISGLAYGIDAEAHKASLKNGLPTIGVVAHGLDTVYPKEHRSLAQEMCKNGGVLTEFPTETTPDRERFPARNRIIAGLADAVIVIESKSSGGSMITANFANDYSKDVFAIPGRINDDYSLGCNKLIKEHKAFLLESADDLLKLMRWDNQSPAQVQRSLFNDLNREQQKIVELVKIGMDDIDTISQSMEMKPSELAGILLDLEFEGVIKKLPGKKYMYLG